MHIPHIATAIKARNEKLEKEGKSKWPLKGLLIGNGWISPYDQSPSYFEFSKAAGLIKEGTEDYREIEALNSVCLAALEDPHSKEMVNIGQCESVLHGITHLRSDEGKCVNTYDVRLEDSFPACGMNWPPDLVDITSYLRRQDVREALHVNPAKTAGWTECNSAVSSTFRASHSTPGVRLLPALLESDVNVLLFSGDQDLICNHLGTENLIHNMNWKGATGFETDPGVWAPRHDWSFEGEPAGLYQYARNLTYVLFYNASHMVPFDQPRQSRDMLDRFMGVDIASIGGSPADSRIDGEKLPQTSVGGHPNSTAAEEQEYKKVKEAENHAYAKSGEAILVIVIIGVTIWGFFIWRSRRTHRGYSGVKNPENRTRVRSGSGSVLDRFHPKRSTPADVEAGDFDESELDTLHSPGVSHEHYVVGDDLSDDEGQEHRSMGGRPPATP